MRGKTTIKDERQLDLVIFLADMMAKDETIESIEITIKTVEPAYESVPVSFGQGQKIVKETKIVLNKVAKEEDELEDAIQAFMKKKGVTKCQPMWAEGSRGCSFDIVTGKSAHLAVGL